jgi:hypothetical protein
MVKLTRVDHLLKRWFPSDGTEPPWRVADKAIYALSPDDRVVLLGCYCPKCGTRYTLDADYNEKSCECKTK